jgi:peptidyl-prolyl cis-trans isomerase SurA
LILFLLGSLPYETYAETAHRIVAIVDRTGISEFDALERARLMIVSAGQTPTPDLIKQVYPGAVQVLVDEILQRKIAEKFKITVTPQEVAQRIQEIEQQSGLEKGALLSHFQSQGISSKAIEKQTEVLLLWMRYIQQKYGHRTSVPPQEVQKVKKKWMQEMRQPVYHVGEIVLYESPKASLDQQKNQSYEIRQMIDEGAPFSELANKFSQSLSRDAGGSTGWKGLDKIDPAFHQWAQQAEVGSIMGPFPFPKDKPNRWMILALLGRKNPDPQTLDEPTDDQISMTLKGEILSLWARKELESLRKNIPHEIYLSGKP